jgi:ParB-like partition proteins
MTPQTKSANKTGIGDLKLSSMLKPKAAVTGAEPQELAIDLIDEDPNQPRKKDNPGFTPESIQGLADTIAARGLKSPISVRVHPDVPGRYMVNHGHRRLRAVKLLGKPLIRGYVDNDYSDDDQVIENLQRNNLTARELAEYVGTQVGKGRSQADIARALGVSKVLVSQHYQLLNLPPSVSGAFNEGRVQDVTVINELARAYRKDPEQVDEWLADEEQEITRGTVKLLQEFISDGGPGRGSEPAGSGQGDGETGGGKDDAGEGKPKAKKDKGGDPEKFRKAILRVRFKDRLARIVMDRRPPAEGFAWVKYDDDGEEVEASLASVQLLALVEA